MEEMNDGLDYPIWESMPLFVKKKIKAATDYVEGHDDASKLSMLNKFLDREGYIGKEALLHTTQFIAMAEIRLATSIAIEPVLDEDILNCSQFQGKFVGCRAEDLDDVGLYATYNVQLEHPDGRLITIKALIDVSTIIFAENDQELGDGDGHVAQAFDTLSDTDVAEYHEIVTSLREAFFDKALLASGPTGLASRLRAIGSMSTFLLAHEEHAADAGKQGALGNIIDESVDISCHYAITGIEIQYERDENIRAHETINPLMIDIVGFTYVPDLEINYSQDGEMVTHICPGMQPAFVAFDIERNRQVTLPLRGLKTLEPITGHMQTVKDFVTCGDRIRAYEKQVALGRIAFTSDILEKYQQDGQG